LVDIDVIIQVGMDQIISSLDDLSSISSHVEYGRQRKTTFYDIKEV
jgi:hypothetical protein